MSTALRPLRLEKERIIGGGKKKSFYFSSEIQRERGGVKPRLLKGREGEGRGQIYKKKKRGETLPALLPQTGKNKEKKREPVFLQGEEGSYRKRKGGGEGGGGSSLRKNPGGKGKKRDEGDSTEEP